MVEKIKVAELKESAIYKLRKNVEQIDDTSEEDEEIGDDFQNLYKGEISKSGTPILPSKRARKIPEKLKVSKEDLEELKGSTDTNVDMAEEKTEEGDVSLDEMSDAENETSEANPENSDTTNS